MSIVSKVTEFGSKITEHKAELGIIFGGICGGAAIVSACLATLKLEGIVDEHEAEVEKVKDNYISHEASPEDKSVVTEVISDVKAYRRDLTKVHVKTAAKVAEAYLPTAVILGFSAYFIGGSYKEIGELKREKKDLLAALYGRELIINRYRDEMRERVGEEEERRFYNNISSKDIEIKEVDDNGKEKKKKVKGADVLNGKVSGDAFIFDESCGSYVGHDINHNLFIAGLLKDQCSDNLYSNRSLLMFEILDAFGKDRDEVPGAFIRGCLSKGPNREDNKVDMDIRLVWVEDEMTGEYVQKILIDPKLDGVIVDKI